MQYFILGLVVGFATNMVLTIAFIIYLLHRHDGGGA